MKTFKYSQWVGTALMACLALPATAQGVRTGYFSDSYLYRHRLNPALANESAYFGFPMLPNMTLNVNSNFGVKDFIFKQPDGSLTTFMNGDVSASQFLDGLKSDNKFHLDYDQTLLSVGFKAFGGYNTVELGSHATIGLSLPKELFAFIKELKNDDYDFDNICLKGRAYANLDFGHSRQINDALRVGGKVKLLFGIAYANAEIDRVQAHLTQDSWQMSVRGNAVVAGGGHFTLDKDGYVDGYDDFTAGLNGFGLGFDLGATYDMKELVDGLKLSAAITDLGFIRWKDCAKAIADEHNTFTFDGFSNMQMHPDADGNRAAYTGTIDEQWDDLEDDLKKLAQFNDNGGQLSSEAEALNATLTLGAEYELPFYKKVSFGALYTQRFGDIYGFAEGRLNVNYAPSRAFDLAVSGSAGSYGCGWGALANLHLPGFSLYVGSDCIYSGSVNSDMVPLDDVNLNLTFGISIPLGW